MQEIHIALIGAAGRMGRNLLPILEAEEPITVVCGLEKVNGGSVDGLDACNGALPLLDSLRARKLSAAWDTGEALRVAVDFSQPKATLFHLRESAKAVPIWIIGTTGFSEAEEEEIRFFSQSTIIVKAGNFSVGLNALVELLETAAKLLGSDYDIEISETHHKHKKDSPSGSARMLLEAAFKIQNSRPRDEKSGEDEAALGEAAVYGRKGAESQRQPGEIGMHSLRGGAVIGDHKALFLGSYDQISLEHRAFSRKAFSSGVVQSVYFAARKYARKDFGLYSMADVLKFQAHAK